MNSPWNKNISLFLKRFPHLAEVVGLSESSKISQEKTPCTIADDKTSLENATATSPCDDIPNDTKTSLENVPCTSTSTRATSDTNCDATDRKKNLTQHIWTIEEAKNGSPTARENGIPLHSLYNPEREAQLAVEKSSDCDAAVFLSFGLGYLPNAYAKLHKDKTIILVEPDANYFLEALKVLEWQEVLTHPKCILAIACSTSDIISMINHFGIKNCQFFVQKNQTLHSQNYFDNLQHLIERNKKKDNINANTLEKFSNLWMKNTCKNLKTFALSDGINSYKNAAKNLFTVVLGAGPSLKDVLPYLAQIKNKALIICTDTALRACLYYNVEPDFIILIDPQYWAAKHLSGLKSPSSILIAESAVYPTVLHFECKKIIFCSSLFPLASFFEKQLGEKGKLEAGGSVATSAWDFARFIGSKAIFFAGLDLSYPQKQTHIQGSTFEQAVFATNNRIKPPQTSNAQSLFSIPTENAKDYDGNLVLTDSRMKLFAWWFESHLAMPNAIKTFTFCPQNMAIPHIQVASIHDFLKNPCVTQEKEIFFKNAMQNSLSTQQKQALSIQFDAISLNLSQSLDNLYQIAKDALKICEKALEKTHIDYAKTFSHLKQIDEKITNHQSKEIVSLIFPTENQLQQLLQNAPQFSDAEKTSLARSKIIYNALCKAIRNYQVFFN